MRNNFSLGDVEAFVAVADHLNYRAAAQSLNISPSALTRRVQKLEDTLNTKLLMRSTREVKLTLSGMEIYARSQELINEISELLDAGQVGRQVPRKITIAATYSHSQTFIPYAAKAFSEKFPNVSIQIMTPRPTEVLDLVRHGVADFGITDMGFKEPTLEFFPIFDERVVLAVPLNHAFAGRDKVSWHEVANERFIAVTKSAPLRVLLDFELARAHANISTFHEVGNIHSALSCVAVGLGVTAATEFAAKLPGYSIATVPLVAPDIVCCRALIRPRDKSMRPTAKAFWELLTSEPNEFRDNISHLYHHP